MSQKISFLRLIQNKGNSNIKDFLVLFTVVAELWHGVRIAKVLNHSFKKSINFVLAVAVVTTLNEVVVLSSPSAVGSVKLEGPQEVRGLLEVGSDCEDFVDQVFHADNVALA